MIPYILCILQVPIVQASIVSFLTGIILGRMSATRPEPQPYINTDSDSDSDEDYDPEEDDESDDEDGPESIWDLFPCTSRCISSMTIKQLRAVTTSRSRTKSYEKGYRNKDQLIHALILDIIDDHDRVSRLPVSVATFLRSAILQDLASSAGRKIQDN
jgi:hypothetical protein